MSKYIGNIPVPNATQSRTRIVATSGQTSFTTSDSYTPGYIDVFLGGVKLDSTEFTATDGTTVVLASGANAGQIFESISYTTFNAAVTTASEASGAFKLQNYTTAQRDALTDSEAGDIIFNTTTGAFEVYGGDGWYAPHAMSIDSFVGTIYVGSATTLNFTSTGLSSTVDIRYYEGATLLATTSGVTVTNGAFSDTVPSAVYGQTSGDTITVKVVSNGAEILAGTKTVDVLPTGSGGTETTSGSYKIHTFTSSGTFTVSNGPLTDIEYLVIAGGGGGGGGWQSGGGGAGGYRSSVVGQNSGGGASAESKISLATGNHTITVGAGGAGGVNGTNSGRGVDGSDSSIGTAVTSVGGGGGGSYHTGSGHTASSGGSGGGAGDAEGNELGGAGTSGQGYAGGGAPGYSGPYSGGGGGGAGSVGGTGGTSLGNGGSGVSSSITGTAVSRAGGGGGGSYNGGGGSATAGGGAGVQSGTSNPGTANTGGGGGGNGANGTTGGAGGSGIVIIRYAV